MARIKVRTAEIKDIPQLVDKLVEFYQMLIQKGSKDIEPRDQELRGGVVMEVGVGFRSDWKFIVAEDAGEIIGFMIGIPEGCSPIQRGFKQIRIHATYLKNDTMAAPKILKSMWGLMEDWGREQGAFGFYANIHPGNQPSVRAAKHTGFKHHYTQFFRPIELEAAEIGGDE